MHNDSEQINKKAFILVVEDDMNLRTVVAENLEADGYDVMATGTGNKADSYIEKFDFDLVVLDINLPDSNGFELCKQWRKNGLNAMILMLTAKDQEQDMLAGFSAGTDDYIVKPYPLSVFLSRVDALLRRRNSTRSGNNDKTIDKYYLPGFDIDSKARKVIYSSTQQEIPFTKIEFDLLTYFLENKNRALNYDEIINAVWGENMVVVQGAIRNTVSSIRKKLESSDKEQTWNIITIRSIGYRLEID